MGPTLGRQPAPSMSKPVGGDPEPQLVAPQNTATTELLDRMRIGKELIAETNSIAATNPGRMSQFKNRKYSWREYSEELVRSQSRPAGRILREYSLESLKRSLSFSIGRLVAQKRPPTANRGSHERRILDKAKPRGFRPTEETR
jgi:hypothetical protein